MTRLLDIAGKWTVGPVRLPAWPPLQGPPLVGGLPLGPRAAYLRKEESCCGVCRRLQPWQKQGNGLPT